MFSSTNNLVNPFAHLPSSSSHQPPLPSPPFMSHDSIDIFLHQQNDLLSANPQFTESLINMAMSNNADTVSKQEGGEYFPTSEGYGVPVRKPAKKDRHSKICTAQGIRDRRVRLSIEIAREFFDLQDLLGFDKASKTLKWLLTKSETAIGELVKMKHGDGSSGGQRSSFSFSSPECEMVAENGDLEGTASKSKSIEGVVVSTERKMKKLQKAAAHLLAKESRAKARARARERTREKMCTSTNEWIRCPDTSPQFLNPLRSLTQLEASKSSEHSHSHNMASPFKPANPHQVEKPSPCQLAGAASRENAIKRKLRPSTILGSHQNIAASKDVSYSTLCNDYFPNLPQNWDINGAIAHSTFCAVTNMNQSTGVQIYGKP